MAITHGDMPNAPRPRTSREINTAIEVLRESGLPDEAMKVVDLWNAARLVDAARQAETNEELRALFTGLRPVGRLGCGLGRES